MSFLLAFNNFEISFYNLGAIPTLPTIAWGTLRHGIEPGLYALASIVNAHVFAGLVSPYLLIRTGRPGLVSANFGDSLLITTCTQR